MILVQVPFNFRFLQIVGRWELWFVVKHFVRSYILIETSGSMLVEAIS